VDSLNYYCYWIIIIIKLIAISSCCLDCTVVIKEINPIIMNDFTTKDFMEPVNIAMVIAITIYVIE